MKSKISKRTLRGLERVNFENKSEKQTRNYLEQKADQLGIKVPKYISDGKLTEDKINRFKDRLIDKAEREVIKNNPNDIELRIDKFNKRIDKIYEQAEKLGIDEKLLILLSGESYTNVYLKGSVSIDNNLLEKIDYQNMNIFDKKSVRDMKAAKLLEEKLERLNNTTVEKELDILREKNNMWFKDFLDIEALSNLEEPNKQLLIDKFDSLTTYQQIETIQLYFEEKKNKYKDLNQIEANVGFVNNSLALMDLALVDY